MLKFRNAEPLEQLGIQNTQGAGEIWRSEVWRPDGPHGAHVGDVTKLTLGHNADVFRGLGTRRPAFCKTLHTDNPWHDTPWRQTNRLALGDVFSVATKGFAFYTYGSHYFEA